MGMKINFGKHREPEHPHATTSSTFAGLMTWSASSKEFPGRLFLGRTRAEALGNMLLSLKSLKLIVIGVTRVRRHRKRMR